MADSKITALTAITGANTATGDLFTVVDVSDTTMAGSGTNKSLTRAQLLAALAQEASTFQPLDATLTALAGLSTGANKVPYSTGTDTFGQTDITPGAWTAFTPVLAGGWAMGNSTYTAAYARVGRMVMFYMEIDIGSSATKGTTLRVGYPVTPATNSDEATSGITAFCADTGTDTKPLVIRGQNNSDGMLITAIGASGTYAIAANITSSVPHTWATGDLIWVGGIYEAAS